MAIKKCKRCGNPKIETKWKTICVDFEGDYCSSKCKSLANKKPHVQKACEYCGEPFHSKWNGQKFCDHSCRYEMQLIRQKRKFHNAKSK